MSMRHFDMSIDMSFVSQFWTKNRHCNNRHLQLRLEIHPSQIPEYGSGRISSGVFRPNNHSVVCHRCINYSKQQQKLPAINNVQVSTQSTQPSFDDVLELGILMDENLWFDLLQDDGITEALKAPKAKKQQNNGGNGNQTKRRRTRTSQPNQSIFHMICYFIPSFTHWRWRSSKPSTQ